MIATVACPPAVRRRTTDGRVNLSSNELHHPAVPGLLRSLFAGWDPAVLWRYPVQADPIAAGAALWARPATEVMLCPGSDAGIRLLLHAGARLPLPAGGTGSGRLILQTPNYETWTTAPETGAWQVIRAWGATAAESADAVTLAANGCRRALVVVSWPNGPAGHTPALRYLAGLRRLCEDRGHLLVIDACYAGFSADPRLVVELAGGSCLVLMSWSKMFGLAGGRLAALFGAADRLAPLRSYGLENQVSALMISAFAGTERVFDDFHAVWREIAGERDRIRLTLRAAGARVPPSGGNFLHVAAPPAGSSAELATRLSDRGYRVRDMDGVSGLDNHVRFTVACGPDGAGFLGSLLAECQARREAA